MKLNCHRLTGQNRYHLRICAGTGILCLDCGILVAQFFDINRSGRQIGNIQCAVGIRGVNARNQVRTSTVGIDAELSACKVGSILRCFHQAECAGLGRHRYGKKGRDRLIVWLCFAGHQLLLFPMLPDEKDLII